MLKLCPIINEVNKLQMGIANGDSMKVALNSSLIGIYIIAIGEAVPVQKLGLSKRIGLDELAGLLVAKERAARKNLKTSN